MNMETQNPPNSVPALLRDLRDEATILLQQEVALARAELRENVSRMTSHALQFAKAWFVAYAGVVLMLIGIGQLLGALLVRLGLPEGFAQWLSPTVVGLAVALSGWAFVARAKAAIAHDDMMPRRTAEMLRETREWARSKLPSSP